MALLIALKLLRLVVNTMDLTVIIVSWNVKEKLKLNLKALYESGGDFKFETFVVDNNSHDGSAEMVRDNFPQVKLIVNTENRGFAAANNQAINLAQGKFVLLLNPDMLVNAETLFKMISWAGENTQAVVSGCKLSNEKGTIVKQVRRFPSLFDQLMIVFKIPHLFPAIVKKYLQLNFDYTVSQRVDSIRGAFFLINVGAYKKISNDKIPLLDERYFIWFEEVDFCREVYKLGGEVWYNADISCIDYVGQSFGQVKRITTQKYFRDSMLSYFQKWGSPIEVKILTIAWKAVSLFVR